MIPYLYPKIETLFTREDPVKGGRRIGRVNPAELRLEEFKLIDRKRWVPYEKIDGMNIRIGFEGEQVFYAGRTDRAQLPQDLVNYLIRTFSCEKMKEAFPDMNTFAEQAGAEAREWAVLYGEGYGAGIQKGGGDYSQDKRFCLFDVKIGRWWLQQTAVEEIAAKFGVPTPPRYGVEDTDYLIGNPSIEDIIQGVRRGLPSLLAEGRRQAEGVILRTDPVLSRRNGDRLIAKLKTVDF